MSFYDMTLYIILFKYILERDTARSRTWHPLLKVLNGKKLPFYIFYFYIRTLNICIWLLR